MLELLGLFVFGIPALLIAGVLIATLLSSVKALAAPSIKELAAPSTTPTHNQFGRRSPITDAIAITLVGACLLLMFTKRSGSDAAGTYQLVAAPKSINPDTYAQYELILNADNTFQAVKLPDSITLCTQGTFKIDDLPDDYHQINFMCQGNYQEVWLDPTSESYQISFNGDVYHEDRSNAFVFERKD